MSTGNFFVTDITGPSNENPDWVDHETFWRSQHEKYNWLGSVGCVELCPTTGRVHAHVVWRQGSNRIRSIQGRYLKLRGIKKGVERRKGSWDDALDYILRRGDHANKEGELLSTWELGEGPSPSGRRTDQEGATAMLARGETMSTVLNAISGSYRYVHALEKAASYVQAEHRDVQVIPCHYEPDMIQALMDEYGDDFIYVHKKWKAYNGEKIVYFYCKDADHLQELYMSMKFEKHVVTASGVVPARWERIYLTH